MVEQGLWCLYLGLYAVPISIDLGSSQQDSTKMDLEFVEFYLGHHNNEKQCGYSFQK